MALGGSEGDEPAASGCLSTPDVVDILGVWQEMSRVLKNETDFRDVHEEMWPDLLEGLQGFFALVSDVLCHNLRWKIVKTKV